MPYVSKHPKSPFWSAWFTDVNGQRTSRSTKMRDRREALKLALQWEQDTKAAREGSLTAAQVLKVYNQMLARSGQKVTAETVEAFAARWLSGKQGTRSKRTAATYGPVVKGFVSSLGARAKAPLTAVAVPDIERFRDKLAGEGKKPSTVRQALKIVGSFFASALRQGLIESNPVRAVEVNDSPQEGREPFTHDEVKALLAHAEGEWKTTILLGAFAGMRLGDAVRLRWDNVDLAGGVITFTPEKTKRKGRVVTMPIIPTLHDYLMNLAGDTDGYLSPTLAVLRSGGRYGLSGIFKALMDKAAIANRVVSEGTGKGRTQSAKSFHSLRHFFNSALVNAGVDEKVRMDLSGHSTASVNRRYSHAELNTLRLAVSKIGNPIA